MRFPYQVARLERWTLEVAEAEGRISLTPGRISLRPARLERARLRMTLEPSLGYQVAELERRTLAEAREALQRHPEAGSS